MKPKFLLLTIVLLNSIVSIGQIYIGKWQHLNNEKQNVIIEFGRNADYFISIQNKRLGAIEQSDGTNLHSNFKYEIDLSTSPAKIDVTSELSGITIFGIIDFIDNETFQLQINKIPGGIRPTKFDPISPGYVKCKKLPNNQDTNGI